MTVCEWRDGRAPDALAGMIPYPGRDTWELAGVGTVHQHTNTARWMAYGFARFHPILGEALLG